MSLYASLTDLSNLGPPSAALASMSSAQKTAQLTAASADADDAIAKRWLLPLTSWPTSLTRRVVDIAVFYLLRSRGFNPANAADATVITAYKDALTWLDQVADGTREPLFVDASPATDEASPLLGSDPAQGWSIDPNGTSTANIPVYDLPDNT